MVLELQTHKEICIRGLALLVIHPKKKKEKRKKKKEKKKKERVLGMLGPLDFLLSIKQSLSCAGVLGPDAWEKK